MRWLLAHDRHGRLRFAPQQGETAGALLGPGAGEPPDPGTVLLLERDAGGRLLRHERSAATARALLTVGGPWALLGRALLLVPRPLADAGYRFIAARRHRLGAAQCVLPADDKRLLP